MEENKFKLEEELGVNFNLDPIFNPNSIAVIGVSNSNMMNPGTIIFTKNMFEMDLGEHVYPINPKGGTVETKKIYKNIKDLPEIPDVSVIAINSKYSFQAIKESIDFGVKGLIVISGGFAEIGEEGKKRQDEISKLCYDSNIPLIGPNCVGIYRAPKIDTIFLPTEKLTIPKKGNVAIVSQSGGVLLDQFFLSFYEREIGISSAISVGNKAVINEVHLLNHFDKDNETQCICFYIEGFKKMEGRQFLEASRKIQKDIVVYRGGISEISNQAVQSHTASLSTNFQISRAAFKQYGIIQPFTEEEVLNYVKTYSVLASAKRKFNIHEAMDGKVAVITVSGGHGIVCVDLLDKYGLKLVQFSEEEMQEMKERVNDTVKTIGSFKNPIDLTGSVADEDIVKVLDYLMELKKIDIIICIVVPYPPLITVQIGRRISLVTRHSNTPLVCFVPYIEKYDLIRDSLELYKIPVAHTVSETVQMAAAIRDKSRAFLRLKMKHKNNIN